MSAPPADRTRSGMALGAAVGWVIGFLAFRARLRGAYFALLNRAEIVGLRAALAHDPAARDGWELDRAEALEAAGRLREAGAAVTAVLRGNPHDVRALEALDWLIVLLQGRALTSSRLKLGGVYVLPLVSPYVAEEPDGPVAGADPGFRLGRSWSVESPTGR